MINKISSVLLALLLFAINTSKLHATPSNDTDTNSFSGKDKALSLIRFSGYIQPQFQWAEKKGIQSFSGGNFPKETNNRFMLRRARLKAQVNTGDTADLLQSSFTFQIDATERGVVPRDVFFTLSENYTGWLTLTTGLFVRPFGYEITYSSQRRESPERGRMSQLLMKTERDVGVMLSVHPQQLKGWQLDAGIFNGPGLAAPADYDGHKDFIGRLHHKGIRMKGNVIVAGGISGYLGSVRSDSSLVFQQSGKQPLFYADDQAQNIGRALPRKYAGADIQCMVPNRFGNTELRAEWILGQQTGSRLSSETPATLQQPLAVRSFQGGYFYLLQQIINERHQLILKYDFYDPNTAAKGKQISEQNGFNRADIAYQTYGFGYLFKLLPQVKMTVYYDLVKNENTALAGFGSDLADDVFTFRLQYEF